MSHPVGDGLANSIGPTAPIHQGLSTIIPTTDTSTAR